MELVCRYFHFFLPTVNHGEERYCETCVKVSSTDSRNVRELPSFCKEFEEVKDLHEIFVSPVSTVNMSDKKVNLIVLTDERKKEFDWLKHVVNLKEFVPDTLWSVYNTRRNKADIVPYFYSVTVTETKFCRLWKTKAFY